MVLVITGACALGIDNVVLYKYTLNTLGGGAEGGFIAV